MLSLMFLMTLLMLTRLTLSTKKTSSSETKSPFECGFTTPKKITLPFSLQFFLVTLMFLIFDIELSILISSMKLIHNPSTSWAMVLLTFMTMMILSFIYELSKNSLQWIK